MIGQVVLGRYRVLRLLGEGGTSQVYLGERIDHSRQVAVKVLSGEGVAQPHLRDLFQREVEFLSRFRHPHVVALLDAALETTPPCLIMEYVAGPALDDLLHRSGRLTVARAGHLLGQLCSALQAVHSQGLIHRDIKAANLMVASPDTPAESLKLLDLGLGRLNAGSAEGPYFALADFGADPKRIIGTPEYLCPEQIRGHSMDHRGDLYSVGVLLFEMLTGRRPFDRPTVAETLRAQARERPPTFAAAGGALVPPAIQRIVERCLAKDPSERPQSAEELARLYEKALGQKILPEDEAMKAVRITPPPATREPKAQATPPDARSVSFQLNAFMPEPIAVMKLRGCLPQIGGEVVSSSPGLLRIRLLRRLALVTPTNGGVLARFGLKPENGSGGRPEWTDMELHMRPTDPRQPGELAITAVLRPPETVTRARWQEWRKYCDRVGVELCAYLMARK